MDYVVVFVLGMLVATFAIRWLARRAIDQLLEKIADVSEEKEESSQQLRVDLAFEQNIYFLYNSDNGSFVAQGNDLIDLKTNLNKRFPNRTITIVKGDPTAMEMLKKQLKDFNENSNSVGSTS